MTPPALSFDPFDRDQRARTMRLCVALDALDALEDTPLPAAPREPDQPAPSPDASGGVEPVAPSPTPISAAADSSRGCPQPGAGVVEPGHNSAAEVPSSCVDHQPGGGAAEPRHPHSDTAGLSLSAVPAGEPFPPSSEGSPAPVSPACPQTSRGNSQAASAPAPSLADPAIRFLRGGTSRGADAPPALSLPAPVDEPAAPTPAVASDAAGAPEPDWPALTARVIDKGETPGAIAAEIGVSVELAASMVVEERARRRRDAPKQVDVDWRALVARVVDGGERVGEVARAAGVRLNALSIRVTRARAGWVFGADGKQTKMPPGWTLDASGRPVSADPPPPSLDAFCEVGKRCLQAIGTPATSKIVGGRKARDIPAGERAGLIEKMEAAIAEAAARAAPAAEPERQSPAAAEPDKPTPIAVQPVQPGDLTPRRRAALMALAAGPLTGRQLENRAPGAASLCNKPLTRLGLVVWDGERWGLTAAGWKAIGVETPGEPEASSTPQGEDAPVTGEGPAAAGAEVVGEDGADPSLSPADAAPEEVEGPSGPEAAAGESPAPSLVPPPRNRHEGLMAQDDLPSDEAGPEVALPRCDGDEGAGARPQQSSQAKPVPEPAGEEPLPDAPTDPDPAPLREPEPIDAAPVAMRPLIDVRRRDTDPDWEAILARVDAGEWPNMVALDEGVDPNALRDRLRARLTAKAAAQAAAVTPEPRDSFWTAQRDYELVRGIIRDGVGKTCAAMGVSDGVALARWNELLPVKGIAEQAALVNRLRVAVEALA